MHKDGLVDLNIQIKKLDADHFQAQIWIQLLYTIIRIYQRAANDKNHS